MKKSRIVFQRAMMRNEI